MSVPPPVVPVVVAPGDTLILVYGHQVTDREIDQAATLITERLPGVKGVIFEGVQQIAVYRPDRPEEGQQ